MPILITRRLRWLSAKLGLERDWYLLILAAMIGLIMGAVAAAFILPLRWMEHLADQIGRSESLGALLLVALAPIAGALLAGVVMHVLASGEGHGPGVATVMYAIHRGKSRLPFMTAINKWLASTLTIGSGGSAGAEGPIVTIGGVIGSTFGQLLKTSPQNTATLLGCGAAAGIASVFNAPIAGIFFVLEVLLRDFSLRTFTPIVIASVISATWTQTMLGTQEPLFGMESAQFAQRAHFTLADIPNCLLLGLVCGAAAPLFIRALYGIEDLYDRWRVHRIIKPATGAAMLAVIGVAYLLLAPRQFGTYSGPPFYGNGYSVIHELLSPHTYFADADQAVLRPAASLLALIVAVTILKALATCLTIGSGGSGGLFAPSLLLGAGIGGAFGIVVNALHWFPATSPAQYALVGMAAMVASLTHAPLTGILLVYEITRQYDIVLPLMLVAVISTIVARLLFPQSVYTWKLARQGVRIGALSDLTILRRMAVHDLPLTPAVVVHRDESAQRLLELSEQHAVNDFVVVDDDQHYSGIVTGADLRATLLYREAVPLLQVSELQRTDLPVVSPDETLDVVLGKFSKHEAQSLAVVDHSAGPRRGAVLGLVTRARLMQHYQNALTRD